ncbi:MAG: type II toxin-antitoxin system HicB family antitoxin [Firmicutes bacterium]|nr:type II toxin-antitoxin system HicB family antitoxin [Bacillota bacterium]
MEEVRVGVEVDPRGRALAWVREWPGCTSHGESEREALERVPQALQEFWAWLNGHGDPEAPPPDTEVRIGAVERSPVESDLREADSEGFFSFDSEPLEPRLLARAKRFRAYARADALALLAELGEEDLRHPVGRSGRTVGATFDHMAIVDLWYAQRAGVPASAEWQAFLLTALGELADGWVHRRLEADPVTVRLFPPDVWGDGRAERWTPQKTLRRFVWHDLLHLRAIRRTLAGTGPGTGRGDRR